MEYLPVSYPGILRKKALNQRDYFLNIHVSNFHPFISPSPCKDDNQYIRISFAYYEKEELQSAVTKLGNLINKYIP